MGGYGSGERWHSKSTTGAALRLDVRWLARKGLIRPSIAAWMPLQWTRNGKPSGNITASYDAGRPDELVLDYRTRATGETDWTDVHEVIMLERTPCHYGGERVWCRCLGCFGRRAVLYSLHGRFRCVACNGLAYSSTREEPLYRYGRRGDKTMDKLGAEREWVLRWIIPPFKPKGMHWKTYERLCREWFEIRDGANGVYEAGLLRLFERIDRYLAKHGKKA